MASIFILFPKDNSEYAAVALQHFQWAIERFDAMSERNRLAAAAMRVLLAIHYRLKAALNVRGPSATPILGIPRHEPATLETGGNFTSPDLQGGTSNNTYKNKAASVSTTGESPAQTNNTGPGSGSVSTRGTSNFTTPGESGDGGPTAVGPFTTVAATPIDPGLTGDDAMAATASDWILPEGFDWSSIQPVYAMADVAYNDLMGFSSGGEGNKYPAGGGAGAGGGGASTSMPHWAGGTPLLNDVPNDGTTAAATGGGGDSQGWMFGGDFGDDSVWSLLNQYPAPY